MSDSIPKWGLAIGQRADLAPSFIHLTFIESGCSSNSTSTLLEIYLSRHSFGLSMHS